jgi:hypothetical protein
MTEEQSKLSWWSQLFRTKAKLTYWLNHNVFVVEVCHFSEKSPDCIIFKDYYTKKSFMVKHNSPITYVLEEIK